MSAFVDTSAFYALLVATEPEHVAVTRTIEKLLGSSRALHTTSYVLVETIALLQHRLGMDPVHDFLETIVPILTVEWVDAALHRRGAMRLLRENRRQISLVDCVSFEFMRRAGLTEALAIDPDFADAGFRVIPGR